MLDSVLDGLRGLKLLKKAEYTVFQGRAGDHNNLAMPGAMAIGAALARRTGTAPFVIGSPEPALNVGWRVELDAALPLLRQVQARLDAVLENRAVSIAATSRCAVALATLPAVAKHHPSVCVLWFDAHADLNTPEATISGYLGGLALAGPAGLWSSGLGAGLRLDQIVLVGARDLDPFEQDLIDQHRIPVVQPGSDLATDLRKAIAGRPVYVHLDCDVLNPGIVPTDFVVPGGLSLDDLHTCAAVIAEHDFVGIEIAEFQSTWEAGGDEVSPDPLLDALAPVLGGKHLS
jgi:arginase